MNRFTLILIQFLQLFLLIAIAPLLTGWIRQIRAWLNNKSGPGILQPYRDLKKLFLKESILPEGASPLFYFVPYIYFAAMSIVAAIIPVISAKLPFSLVADIIVLVGIFALGRIFLALAAMDLGTPFGGFGARREMFVSFLSEPALLMVFFNVALLSQSTSLAMTVQHILSEPLTINPSLAFSMVAFLMVLLAENARIPIDNPSTHLELTMIHEAMILEYSGQYLALIEWASDLKLLNYFAIAIALFAPWGMADAVTFPNIFLAAVIFLLKIFSLGCCLALFEIVTTKMRLFLVPQFLGSAFLIAILGVLIQLLLER